MLSQLFGTEYSDDIALLVGSLGEYEKALGLVADKGQVVGAMQKEVANAMSTSEAQINKAKQEIINVAIEVGEKLLPLVSLSARLQTVCTCGFTAKRLHTMRAIFRCRLLVLIR